MIMNILEMVACDVYMMRLQVAFGLTTDEGHTCLNLCPGLCVDHWDLSRHHRLVKHSIEIHRKQNLSACILNLETFYSL